MLQKRMFKLLSPIPKKDGGTYWMRCGSGFTNRDDSINIFLDALPKGGDWKFQLRLMDEEDLRRREPTGYGAAASSPPPLDLPPPTSQDQIPF